MDSLMINETMDFYGDFDLNDIEELRQDLRDEAILDSWERFIEEQASDGNLMDVADFMNNRHQPDPDDRVPF